MHIYIMTMHIYAENAVGLLITYATLISTESTDNLVHINSPQSLFPSTKIFFSAIEQSQCQSLSIDTLS